MSQPSESPRRGRVLLVVNHAGFFVSHRLPIAVAARATGYDVHVATPRSRHVPAVEAAGLAWHPIPLSRSGRNPAHELRSVRALYRLYRRLRPDVVHHITSKPVLYGTPAARAARVPAVVNAISGMGHVFASRRKASRELMRRMIALGYRFSLRHPRMRVIFQNVDQRTEFVERRWTQPGDAVLIPGAGVDTSRFAPPANPADGEPLVVLPSRMIWSKGVAEFVAAATALRADGVRARFALVGEPDPDNPASIDDRQLRAWAAEGTVEYWGRREDMPEVLRQAHVACLPTFYPEGVPKALIEAAACGLPIVATEIAGCRAIVVHGENGLLVPIHDVARLADALRVLLDSPDLRARMGAAGRARAVREFSLEHVVDAHLSVYAELLARPPAPSA